MTRFVSMCQPAPFFYGVKPDKNGHEQCRIVVAIMNVFKLSYKRVFDISIVEDMSNGLELCLNDKSLLTNRQFFKLWLLR